MGGWHALKSGFSQCLSSLARWHACDFQTVNYVIEQTTNANSTAAWTRAGESTKAKASGNGLSSGTKYWFLVAADGAAGQRARCERIGGVAGDVDTNRQH